MYNRQSIVTRRFLIALIVLVTVLSAVWMPGGAHAQKAKIIIGAGQDASTLPMKTMIDDGTAAKALGFDVEWVEFPYGDLYTKLVQGGQSKSSDFDLVMMDDPWLPQFAAS